MVGLLSYHFGDNTVCLILTRNSAIADKPRDAFRGQPRPPNMT